MDDSLGVGKGPRTVRVQLVDADPAVTTSSVEASLGSLPGIHGVTVNETTGFVTVEYNPDRTSETTIIDRLSVAGFTPNDTTLDEKPTVEMNTLTLSVPDMDCASCASKIDTALARTSGIQSVETRPTAGKITVRTSADVSIDRVIGSIGDAGYEASVIDDDGGRSSHGIDTHRRSPWRSKRAGSTFIGAVLISIGGLITLGLPSVDSTLLTIGSQSLTLSQGLFVGAAAVAGIPILRSGYYSARNRNLDIHVLMSVGIVASVLTFHPFEGAMLAVLFSIAELLERFSMERARDSLRELLDRSPKVATVRRENGDTETVPVDALDVGDEVIVQPGDYVPADGVVIEGQSAVDQSPITGESVPVDKSRGDEVFAGTIAESGYLEVAVERAAEDSTITRIIELVEGADRERTNREQFVDRFAAVYTPIMVLLAIAVASVPPLLVGASWNTWFLRGLTVLVIACPCALVISTPVSVVSGITSAAKHGVLIKGGKHLEAIGDSSILAIDKTGTLTTGELRVTDVIPLGDMTEDEILQRASAIERRSEHPIAEAIVVATATGEIGTTAPTSDADDGYSVNYSEGNDQPPMPEQDFEVSRFEALAGVGAKADLDGQTHYIGKPDLFDGIADLTHVHATPDGGVSGDHSTDFEDRADNRSCSKEGCLDVLNEVIPRLEAQGKTVVLVGTADRPMGLIGVTDRVRPTARWAVSRLQEQGVRVVMLTGDNEGTARAIADAVGIDDYHANLLPEEKLDWIRRLERGQFRDDGRSLKREDDESVEGGLERTTIESPVTDRQDTSSDRDENLDRERSSDRPTHHVAMVGDGINDAPALATATVGIAMGAAGTDTALETADVALLGDDLTKLPYLYRLSNSATGVIRQNIGSSLVVKAVLVAGAPFGIVTVIHAVVIGDMGMSLGVTGNAMRLSSVTPERPPAR